MTRLAFLGIPFFLSLPALAADLPQLGVVGIHQEGIDDDAQKRAINALIEAVEGTGKANGLASDEVVTAVSGREQIIVEEAALGPGLQALLNGKNLYNQALPAEAVPVLQQCIATLAQGIIGANTTKDLWEAYVYLGTSHLGLEDEGAAQEAFSAAAALNPARSPNPALFPPFVVEAYDAARTSLSAHKRPLTVTVDGNATIYVNGEKKGTGSITADVLPGLHYIVARADGKQAYEAVAVPALPEGPPAEEGAVPAAFAVDLTLGAATLGTPGTSEAARSRQTAALYRALGEHAKGVDLFLLAGVDDSLLYLQLYAPGSDAFSKQVEIPYADTADDEAVQTVPLLLNVLDKTGALPPAATSPTIAPLSIGANSELAALLTQPRAPVAIGGGTTDKKKVKAWPILLGVVAAGAVGGGGYAGYAALSGGSDGGGTVTVGPF